MPGDSKDTTKHKFLYSPCSVSGLGWFFVLFFFGAVNRISVCEPTSFWVMCVLVPLITSD